MTDELVEFVAEWLAVNDAGGCKVHWTLCLDDYRREAYRNRVRPLLSALQERGVVRMSGYHRSDTFQVRPVMVEPLLPEEKK